MARFLVLAAMLELSSCGHRPSQWSWLWYECSTGSMHVICRLLHRVPAVLELAPLCARVLITERSSEAARARLLGYIGVCVGVGIVVRCLAAASDVTRTDSSCCSALMCYACLLCCLQSHTYSALMLKERRWAPPWVAG